MHVGGLERVNSPPPSNVDWLWSVSAALCAGGRGARGRRGGRRRRSRRRLWQRLAEEGEHGGGLLGRGGRRRRRRRILALFELPQALFRLGFALGLFLDAVLFALDSLLLLGELLGLGWGGGGGGGGGGSTLVAATRWAASRCGAAAAGGEGWGGGWWGLELCGASLLCTDISGWAQAERAPDRDCADVHAVAHDEQRLSIHLFQPHMPRIARDLDVAIRPAT